MLLSDAMLQRSGVFCGLGVKQHFQQNSQNRVVVNTLIDIKESGWSVLMSDFDWFSG